MGNRHYEQIILSPTKRNWISIYGLMQFISEASSFTCGVLMACEGKIALPLFIISSLILKKLWILAWDHRIIGYSNDEPSLLIYLGMTPPVISDQYVYQRDIETFWHFGLNFILLAYQIVFNEMKVLLVISVITGLLFQFGFLSQRGYLLYENDKKLLLKAIEQTIGFLVIEIAAFLMYSQGILFFIGHVTIVLSQAYLLIKSKHVNLTEESIVYSLQSSFCGCLDFPIRDSKISRAYCKVDYNSKQLLFSVLAIIQMIIFILVDYILRKLFSNEGEDYSLILRIEYCLVMLFIPSGISIFKDYFKQTNDKLKPSVYSFKQFELEDVSKQQIIKNHLDSLPQTKTNIIYLMELSEEKLQIFLEYALNDTKRFYIIYIKRCLMQKFIHSITIKAEQEILKLSILFQGESFLRFALRSLVESNLSISTERIEIQLNDQNRELNFDSAKLVFWSFYQLSNMRIRYCQNDEQSRLFGKSPYEEVILQARVFHRIVSPYLLCNPYQVLYDLYENI